MSRPAPDPVFILRGSTASVTCLKFLPETSSVNESSQLVSGSVNGQVTIWNLKNMRPHHQVDGHPGQSILGVDILSDGTLLSHGRNGQMKMWSLERGCVETDCFSLPIIGFCQFSTLQPDNSLTWLATAVTTQSEVDILDLKTKEVIHRAVPKEDHKLGMCMCLKLFKNPSTSKPFLLAGYEDGTLALWDITAGKILSTCLQHDREPVMCLDLDQTSFSRGVTGAADSKIAVFSIDYDKGCLEPEETSCVQLKNPGTGVVRIRQDSRIMAAGSWNGKIRIYNWKKMKPLALLNYHSEPINCLGFSSPPNLTDRLLAAGCKDGRISLWSIYSDK